MVYGLSAHALGTQPFEIQIYKLFSVNTATHPQFLATAIITIFLVAKKIVIFGENNYLRI
jgi:hypothetical protein